jgi:hypothetical protein
MFFWLAACIENAPTDDVTLNLDSDSDVADLPNAVCPPVGADAVEPLVLNACDGSAVTLHDLCGEPALVTHLYGWCPGCFNHLDLAVGIVAEHGIMSWLVITEDPLGAPPSEEYCSAFELQYPTVTVLTDADRDLESRYGGPDLMLVLDRDGQVIMAREDASDDAILQAVSDVLP